MDQVKFTQFVREFPFLAKILAEGISHTPVDANSISYIEVKRGDRNLLEVRPGGWNHDAGSFAHYGHRHFWAVSPGEIVSLTSAFHKSEVPHGTTVSQDTDPIGAQLLRLNRDVQFIVEVHAENWDWEEEIPEVVIYKMQDFAWRHFCRPTQVTQS